MLGLECNMSLIFCCFRLNPQRSKADSSRRCGENIRYLFKMKYLAYLTEQKKYYDASLT